MSLRPDMGIAARRSTPAWRAACFLCILAIWAGFPNDLFDFPPAVFFWPISLAWCGLSARNARQAILIGWGATFAGMMAALYWLSFPVHYVGALPWAGAVACACLICACLAIQGAMFCLAAFLLKKFSSWALSICLCLLWYLLEYALAMALGFPWLPLAGALPSWPFMMQGAAIVGAYFLGAMWLFAFLATCLSFRPTPSQTRVFYPALCLAGIGMAILLGGYGLWRLDTVEDAPRTGEKDTVAALFVEGNVDQNQKWVPAFQRGTLDLYISLTEKGVADVREQGMPKPLVLWPETALPFFFENNPPLARLVRKCAISTGCPILFGAPGLGKLPGLPEDAVYNRAFLLGPDGKTLGYYDKEHLVPFGEYLPQWLNFSFLQALLQGVGIYQEGTATRPLSWPPLALGMLICYEGIFPWLAQTRVEDGANILVDISNDGWFGHSPAARQHLYLTILRCVEQNRWLLRATNTGISAIADNYGRIVLAGPQFETGWLAGLARLKKEFTLYHEFGRWLPLLALILLGVCIAMGMTRRKE